MRSILALALCALIVSAPSSARQPKKEGLTPLQAVETARLMKNPEALGPGNTEGLVSLSPDRRRYVMRVVKGDAKANGVWTELFAGDLTTLDSAAAPASIARTLSSGMGTGGNVFGAVHDVDEYSSPIRWLDNDRIVFLSSNAKGIRQLVSANLTSHTLEFMTDHPTNVVTFDIAADSSIFYSAQAGPRAFDSETAMKAGYVIPTGTDAAALFRRDLSGSNIFDNAWATQWFIKDGATKAIRQIKPLGRDRESMYGNRATWSPDGKFAIINAAPKAIPADWSLYKQRDVGSRIAMASRNPEESLARTVNQHFVIDVKTGATRPLWNTVAMISLAQVAWSADAKSVLLAPTFLPPAEDDSTLFSGDAAAIVDVATGRHARLPLKIENPLGVAGLRWIDAAHVEIDMRKGPMLTRHRFVKNGKTWVADRTAEPLTAGSAISMQLRQDLNTPPKLFAVDGATKQDKLVIDFNPGLADNVALGRAEKVEGKLESGIPWAGLLFYPPDYDAKKRYPLVIQSVYGSRFDDSFTLYGWQFGGGGLGPTPIATYPGRALAARGMLVLQVDVMMAQKFGGTEEAAIRQQGAEAAIAYLDGLKLIDPARIGIVGFSRNGFYVEYALTHSSFPFAAAIAADNWDPSYMQQTLAGAYAGTVPTIGQEPFGVGLESWLENSPGFNTERITAPLMMIDQSIGMFGVFLKWETFNRLRYLNKPVEFYVMPDAEAHGSHNTQNPAQVLALMSRSIDWFDFWLNGREDASPAKAAQYVSWRRLRDQQAAASKKPRPPLLDWKATAKE
jgi:dienelactone hydrolase